MIMYLIAAASAATQPNCKNPQTQFDMNQCAAVKFQDADAAMKRQWDVARTLMKRQDRQPNSDNDRRPGYWAALLDGQRAWLKYRDAYCVSEGYAARGGTMEMQLLNSCLEKLTVARTKQLESLVRMFNR